MQVAPRSDEAPSRTERVVVNIAGWALAACLLILGPLLGLVSHATAAFLACAPLATLVFVNVNAARGRSARVAFSSIMTTLRQSD